MNRLCQTLWSSVCAASVVASAAAVAWGAPGDYFGLHFVDEQTGRGVPMVTVELTSELELVSDSNGYVAFDEPGLMDQNVFFGVRSYGYEAKDVGFNNPGLITRTTPGKVVEVKLKRTNVAERLYRLTGSGIYRDTVLLGKKPPIDQPLLDGRVMGQDTVQTAVYKGKMVWCWGDTDRPDFPLGLFHTAGATSDLPAKLNLDRGINYTYFTGKDGFCRPMIELKRKVGTPIWIDGLMVVTDERRQQKLLARYVVVRHDMSVLERGILLFNDASQTFEQLVVIPMDAPACPGGRPMRAVVGGKEYYYFPDPYPALRVPADYAHATDPAAYEGLTCLTADGKADRDAAGKLRWSWKAGVRPVDAKRAERLVRDGTIKAEETPYQLRDVDGGKHIALANGGVAWDAWADKWVMVFGQQGGSSTLGEMWVAFAHGPEGPWTDARKVATHAAKGNNNDFYNPVLHGDFFQQDGRVVYFEGTLVNTFSGNPHPTPRYNYNQILYRLDLADPRVNLPDPPPALVGDARPSKLGP